MKKWRDETLRTLRSWWLIKKNSGGKRTIRNGVHSKREKFRDLPEIYYRSRGIA